MDPALFIGDKVVERTVELADGSKHVMHFKELPNTAFERYGIWCTSDDEDVQASAQARLVSLGLCEPDGSQAVTPEAASRIKRPVLQAIVAELLDVNGYSKKKKAPAGND